MPDPDFAKVRALASRALGTCEGYVDEISELTLAECYELDMLVMCCISCDWWYEPHELDEDQLCGDCRAR